jgi:adenylate kinase family enzyme
MKISICGKMCSGKTTLAKYIYSLKENTKIISFADKLKEIARDLFNMEDKDRNLLILLGKKMREIDPNVWINATIKKSKQFENLIIDDIKYFNELKTLRDNGFKIIKLNISDDLQLKRLKNTYPETWKSHFKYIRDKSESQMDLLDNKYFDIEINVDNDNIFEKINLFIKNI